jgi:probable phosphoglycerate mutase
VYILRHGAVESSAGGKHYIGQKDLALSDIGLQQANAWADYFSSAALEEIYCSDLSRCLETARIIASRCSLKPQVLPELREISLGAWEGLSFNAVKRQYLQEFEKRGEQIADHRPPRGESFHDLQERVWPVFEAVVRRHRSKTLVVTHAGVIRVLVCRLLGMPLENLFAIGQDYGALNIIDARPKSYRVQALNLEPVV